MEGDKQNKAARKRRRPAGDASESAQSDDNGNKYYSIRSRRTQAKSTSEDHDAQSSEKEVSSPSSPILPPVPVPDTEHTTTSSTATTTKVVVSPALQQATRELHARIMSRVRDLAPSFSPVNSRPSTPAPPPAPITPPTTPKINTDITTAPNTPTTAPSAPSPVSTTSRTVKELQHLISVYVQQQRAHFGIANPLGISPVSTPTGNASTNVHTRASSTPTVANTARVPTDTSSHRGVSNDATFQKSSIIANKFSNAINKYTRSPNALNPTSMSSTAHHAGQHPTTSGPHYNMNGSKPFSPSMGPEHEAPSSARSAASFTRPITSVLENRVPSLSLQYKHNQKEKRRKTEYGYYDDTSSNSSESNTNYFLLAAQHELQNMDEEIATNERLEMMESEIERLQRALAMRDRVIRKLHEEIEEKDEIIQAMPYELVSNWVAASHMMMPMNALYGAN